MKEKNGARSLDYIFKEVDGRRELIGNFESFYKNEDDPWSQSATSGEISNYYLHSRKRLTDQLKKIKCNSLIDIGCGLGYTTNDMQQSLPNTEVLGMDVSPTAVMKARKLFPHLNFLEGNIGSKDLFLEKKYDVLVLNQLLWYILEGLSVSLENCFSMLSAGGSVIFSQAFLRSPQRYGTDICDGFEGLISYLSNNTQHMFNIEYTDFDESNTFVHNDGLIILRKI